MQRRPTKLSKLDEKILQGTARERYDASFWYLWIMLILVVFLPPGVDEEEDPGEAEDEVADGLAGPVASEIFEAALEVEAPEGRSGVEEDASLGEEGLEGAVLDKGDHEEEEADGEEEEASEGVRGLDQQLVVRRGALKPLRCFPAVADHRDLAEVEHH